MTSEIAAPAAGAADGAGDVPADDGGVVDDDEGELPEDVWRLLGVAARLRAAGNQ